MSEKKSGIWGQENTLIRTNGANWLSLIKESFQVLRTSTFLENWSKGKRIYQVLQSTRVCNGTNSVPKFLEARYKRAQDQLISTRSSLYKQVNQHLHNTKLLKQTRSGETAQTIVHSAETRLRRERDFLKSKRWLIWILIMPRARTTPSLKLSSKTWWSEKSLEKHGSTKPRRNKRSNLGHVTLNQTWWEF